MDILSISYSINGHSIQTVIQAVPGCNGKDTDFWVKCNVLFPIIRSSVEIPLDLIPPMSIHILGYPIKENSGVYCLDIDRRKLTEYFQSKISLKDAAMQALARIQSDMTMYLQHILNNPLS